MAIGHQRRKNISRVAKRALGGPKSENLLYLSNYDSTRPKNWQILKPNWYIALEKALWALDCIKIGYWASKAQK